MQLPLLHFIKSHHAHKSTEPLNFFLFFFTCSISCSTPEKTAKTEAYKNQTGLKGVEMCSHSVQQLMIHVSHLAVPKHDRRRVLAYRLQAIFIFVAGFTQTQSNIIFSKKNKKKTVHLKKLICSVELQSCVIHCGTEGLPAQTTPLIWFDWWSFQPAFFFVTSCTTLMY